ncbi:Uma2 family endonuclease [Desulfamplus magnetovallimortis]|nr:Uma2 family endonuclease [Desulfamplus magnetovallimortis]
MNVQVQPQSKMTPDEYFEFDNKSDIRHEFFDGELFAMTGATKNHNLINTSLTVNLVNGITNSTCRVFSNDMRVKIENGYVYPDLAVACSDLEFESNDLDTLTNPIVIVEILSNSTEAFDRGDKFSYYRMIPTLKEYILVSQNKCRVEQFIRKEKKMWSMLYYEDMAQIMKIESVNCELLLSDIYKWVEFNK